MAGKYIFLDFETRSLCDITERGLANYSHDPSTQALMLSYAINDGDVKLWDGRGEALRLADMPSDLADGLSDPDVKIVAWHSAFERSIFRDVLKRDIPIHRFYDPAVLSRYCALPGKLENACIALGMSEEEAKIGDGKRLIKLFSEPADRGGKETLFGVTEPYFRGPDRHAADWELFKQYNIRDVETERTVLRKLWPLRPPQEEWDMWVLDQKINEAGLPVDNLMVDAAIALTARAQAELNERFRELTGLANPNSIVQLLPWAQEHGFPYNSMGKRWVNAALNEKSTIDDACREAFTLRQQLAKTSVKKFSAIKDLTHGERLKHQFVFMGASSTARWSSAGGEQKGVQVHNLPRPIKSVEKEMDLAVELVRNADYDGIELVFGSVLDTVASTVRGAFRAPEGKLLVVADLSAIEYRVVAYEADCEKMLEVCRTGKDPYKSFGVYWLEKPYEEITKDERNLCKPPTLGCGYLLGGGEEEENKDGDIIRTGLWGYAQNMGVEMTRQQAHRAVQVYRSTYTDVTKLWGKIMEAARFAIRNAKPAEAGKCQYNIKHEYLCVLLPSGRELHYAKPMIRREDGHKGKTYENIYYTKFSSKTGLGFEAQYSPNRAIENNTQAIARDILCSGLRLADAAGMEIVGSIHDEIITLADAQRAEQQLEELRQAMSQNPVWCKDLPLAAEGFFAKTYRK